jgi:hypothetical protein
MSKTIDLNKTLYELSKEDPQIIEIMMELGFQDIRKPGVLQTAGRVMTIPKGAAMKKMDMEIIKQAFRKNGYDIRE